MLVRENGGVRWGRWILGLVFVVLVVGGLWGWGSYRELYPYGRSHKCDKVAFSILKNYAEVHGGDFPDGAGRGEALSKLVPDYADLDFVCGKTVDGGVAEEYFAEHGVLSDELVGWGYRPGLREDSYEGLALLWDPSGLGHNGEVQDRSWHTVIYVSGMMDRISGEEWEAFLVKQEVLVEKYGLGKVE